MAHCAWITSGSMDTENLVKMINNISSFFSAEPQFEDAVSGVSDHVKRFWELRMRLAIIDYYRAGGAGLTELSTAAVARLASEQDKLLHAGNG